MRGRNRHTWTGRRGLAATATAVVCGLGGVGALGYAFSHQRIAPTPAPAAIGTLPPVHRPDPRPSPGGPPGDLPAPVSSGTTPSTPASPATPGTAGGPALPAAEPTAIRIPAIDVSSRLARVGLTPDGTIEVPHGRHYDQAAWYTGSPTPGELGTAVIVGHIDSAARGPSVFFRLGALEPGDTVKIPRADGTVAVFEVGAVRMYPKEDFPTRIVYGPTGRAALRLITCGGSFNDTTGHYRSNIVVFAHLTGARSG